MSNIFWSAAFSAWCASYSPTSLASPAKLQTEIRPKIFVAFPKGPGATGELQCSSGNSQPLQRVGTVGRQETQDLEGPEGKWTLWICNFGRKMRAGEYKWNKYSQIMYKTIFKKVYPPRPKVFLSTLRKAFKGHKPTGALGFTSSPYVQGIWLPWSSTRRLCDQKKRLHWKRNVRSNKASVLTCVFTNYMSNLCN